MTFTSTLSFDEVERIPMQNGRGKKRWSIWSYKQNLGDYIPDRAGGADTFNTSGGYFTGGQTGAVYYPITAKNSQETL